MKNLWYLFGIALIFWLGIYSVIGMWVVLAMLLSGIALIALFYKLIKG